MAEKAGFTGLTMPVFTAFGWAGEETALAFALDQLEQFINLLHAKLSREARGEFPFWGLDKEAKNAYISTQEELSAGPYIEFNVRPTALEIRLCVTDRPALSKGLRAAERDPENWHRLMTKLGPDWNLQINQSQVDEDTEAVTNYQDLFKDSVEAFDLETCKEVTARAHFLNAEDKWITPIYVSHRIPAEKAAAMGTKVTKVVSGEVDQLLSVLAIFTKRMTRKSSASKTTKKTKKKATQKSAATKQTAGATAKVKEDQFTYVAELKPLHLRKGFINLTTGHWPFFTINARTASRPVTIKYADHSDKNCSVWRLQPNDLARIVLSERVHEWLEDTFEANNKIKVEGVKKEDNEIEINLALAE